ncbi:hypothetical protein OH77DRAFT_689158 [Trametes cingulata]|nr:hypothetical protein OH77DRAFT_689158 [Trametes cingulata]
MGAKRPNTTRHTVCEGRGRSLRAMLEVLLMLSPSLPTHLLSIVWMCWGDLMR